MQRERTRYREFTSWPGLAHAIIWGAIVLSGYPILAGWDEDLPSHLGRWLLVGSIAGTVGALTYALGGLTVMVQESRLVIHLGRVPLIRTTIDFASIVSLRSIEYRPILEFGGWGVRGGRHRRAWSARGNRAVALRLADGREVLIGSDHPQRLEERIRALGADQIGGAAPE